MIITDKSQISTLATIPTTQSAPSKRACEMSVTIIQSLTKQIEYCNLELFKVKCEMSVKIMQSLTKQIEYLSYLR